MMSDDMLSQDEIDALLKGTADDADENEQNQAGQQPPVEDYLSTLEQDALGEIGNISFGSSATALSSLLNHKVEITTPTISVVERDKLSEEFPQPNVAIQVTYTEGFSGMNLLVIKQTDAAIIADLMLGGDGTSPSDEMNDIHLSAVQEAMNQMMGSAATSMSTVFNKRVDISPPTIDLLDVQEGEGTETIPKKDVLVKVSFQLKVGNLIDSNIMQLLPVEFAKQLVDQLLNPPEEEESNQLDQSKTAKEVERPVSQMTNNPTPETNQNGHQTQTNAAQQAQSQGQQAQQGPQYLGGMQGGAESTIQSAQFSSFDQVELPQNEQRNLDMLLDIPLRVTVELGRTKRTIKEILELSSGSVVELDKLAGEPVDILVNDKPIAKGEVVVIDENFGVRVTDILSQKDRLKRIQ
ncbi:flagellar motor switch phosphatase FliY [Pontibacillus yanchengensis]|uniref:Flagellar motor switch phosphatase FliY n=2 Tax=Pontibacillus yanchengensis TaxID=462910 RepID=A0ACC7VAW7_9BACI|nr:flagellar motor switch phosphatase FliY [Pontibacillus yanchengensis]MYL33152.1 flagellar motor switch phosphatase FliY [Pontibacillus yanchengensis]MYL51998.1 flagellar motor switch phosphatase FliY [Pontibacillus yanchengensis]